MNQSWNTSAIKLDSNHRNNFVGIALNAAADNFVQMKCSAAQFEALKNYSFEIRKDKYRATTFGAVSPRALRHPTHQDYETISDGQKPLNLQAIKWLPLTIPLASGWEHLNKIKTDSSKCEESKEESTRSEPVQKPFAERSEAVACNNKTELNPFSVQPESLSEREANGLELNMKQYLHFPECHPLELELAARGWNQGIRSKEKLCCYVWGKLKRGENKDWVGASQKIIQIARQLKLEARWVK